MRASASEGLFVLSYLLKRALAVRYEAQVQYLSFAPQTLVSDVTSKQVLQLLQANVD